MKMAVSLRTFAGESVMLMDNSKRVPVVVQSRVSS